MDLVESLANTRNDGNESLEEIQKKEAILFTRYIAYNVVAPIIISMGLLGNILTIFIINHPTFKGVMFNFYFALAAFDFLSLFCSISGIFHLIHPATSSFPLVVWYSYFESLFINAFMGVSILIVVCITFDRYMSVRHPQKFKVIHTNKFCIVGIICSCAISFLIWLPSCFIRKPTLAKDCSTYVFKDNATTLWVACRYISPSRVRLYNAYTWIREIILAFLPIAIVIVFNGFLVKYFIDKHKRSRSVNPRTRRPRRGFTISHSRRVGDKSLSSLLQAIILCLLITLLPSGIFNAMHFDTKSRNLKFEIFRALAYNLELLNHALNFYLYVLMSKPVQSALPYVFSNMKKSLLGKFNITPKSNISNTNDIPHFSKYSVNAEEHSMDKEDSKFSQQSQLSENSHADNLGHEEIPKDIAVVHNPSLSNTFPSPTLTNHISETCSPSLYPHKT